MATPELPLPPAPPAAVAAFLAAFLVSFGRLDAAAQREVTVRMTAMFDRRPDLLPAATGRGAM